MTTMLPADWRTGYVTIDGTITVLAQYDHHTRWNGWLCPSLDPRSVVAVVDTLNALNAEVGEPGLVLDWDGDVLVLDDLCYPDDPAERIEPDADGLYALGAWAWTWETDQWCNHDAVAVRGGVCECGARVS